MGLPLVGTNRCVRYTTLTCLLCQTLAYRVQQLVPQDVEGQEGPLLPTHDWVEQDILMSSSGWIEVHSNCLVSHLFPSFMHSTTSPDCGDILWLETCSIIPLTYDMM
jgi:hypothetical protein